jgi:hypothetical protein
VSSSSSRPCRFIPASPRSRSMRRPEDHRCTLSGRGELLHAAEPPSISPRRPTAADGESDDSVRSAQHPRKATPPSSPSLGEYSHENSGVVLVLLDLAASRRAIQPAQAIRRRAAVSSLSLLRR